MVALAATEHLNPSPSQSETLNKLIGAIFLLAFATTLITTLLISYRIHSFFKEDLSNGFRSRFKHVVEILIQSAAAYSVVTIAFAVVSIIPTETSVPVLDARSYTSSLYFFTAVRLYHLISYF